MVAEACSQRIAGSPEKSAYRARLALQHGYRLAEEAGRTDPGLRDAVWELLLEAAATLRRLPNRERGWLTASTRAHWPAFVQSLEGHAAEATAGSAGSGVAGLRPAPAAAEAIDRMDQVLVWLTHVGGAKPQRDLAVLFGLACGLKVSSLRRRFGCGRRTIYDIRDRALTRLCSWLAREYGIAEP